MPTIYFDHNATTPIAPEVAETMVAAVARGVWECIEHSRAGTTSAAAVGKIAANHRRILHASPAEFVFTSGGTESNNLALLGLVRNLPSSSQARHHDLY